MQQKDKDAVENFATQTVLKYSGGLQMYTVACKGRAVSDASSRKNMHELPQSKSIFMSLLSKLTKEVQ